MVGRWETSFGHSRLAPSSAAPLPAPPAARICAARGPARPATPALPRSKAELSPRHKLFIKETQKSHSGIGLDGIDFFLHLSKGELFFF